MADAASAPGFLTPERGSGTNDGGYVCDECGAADGHKVGCGWAMFSLREIRDVAERYSDGQRGPGAVVTPEAVLALVDAVKAARDYLAALDAEGMADDDLLRSALGRLV